MPQTNRPRRQNSRRATTGPAAWVYVLITGVVIVSMLLAGLSAVDFSGFLGEEEPTPDYSNNVVDQQRAVVDANPDDPAARAMLASLLTNSGNLTEAIREYEHALELAPNDTGIRLDFARSLQANNRPQDAEAQFKKVLELQPENHAAHYYLAKLYMDWQPRRLDEAIPHFHLVIELAPDSFLAEQSRAVLDTLDLATPVASPSNQQ